MLVIFLVHSPPCILRQGFSLESESMDFNRLPAPGCLSLPYTGHPCRGPASGLPSLGLQERGLPSLPFPHPPYDHVNGPEIDHLN